MQSANMCDTDRTEMSLENIKASLTSTLKTRTREVCKHTNYCFKNKKQELKTAISHYLKHTTHYQK